MEWTETDVEWTEVHGRLLGRAFEQVLGPPEAGAMAFVRCLTPDVVKRLAMDNSFTPGDWDVVRVAEADDTVTRTILADAAVERRETKGAATLLLVDTDRAGAGMDGIYSASREMDEPSLFKAARRLADEEVTHRLSRVHRQYAEQAIRIARRVGGVSPWAAFDFLVHVAASKDDPGAHLYRLGLWPIIESDESDATPELDLSCRLVDQLLGVAASGVSIPARIESLQLASLSQEQRNDLERFLHDAETDSRLPALQALVGKKHLWVGALRTESAHDIQAIELVPWRNMNGRVAKWSGLVEGSNDKPPELILKPDAVSSRDYSRLEIKWKARPGNIKKGSVAYRVAVLTDNMEEELAVREVRHSARKEEKCRFSNDDFSSLDEDTLISAKAVVFVVGDDTVERRESEEFLIRFGEPPERTAGGACAKVRAFSEGLVELDDRDKVSTIADGPVGFDFDMKSASVLLRRPAGVRRVSLSVSCPPLIHDVEKQWTDRAGVPGRWRVKVRDSGARAGDLDFICFDGGANQKLTSPQYLTRVKDASRRLADRFRKGGGVVGQIHDDKSKTFEFVKEYILAWTALLADCDPLLTLCNTVEVQSLAGRTLGLIVLPMHPLRVAWHAAYDNLVLHAAFEQGRKPKDIRDELRCLDGAMFPAFLPNPSGGSFIFADTLGFHVVGMVPDTDREPKAAVAILARALGEGGSTDNVPTIGGQSAKVVGDEIVKYLGCHDTSRLLRVHALRAGDGLTIARSLGHVHDRLRVPDGEDDDYVAHGLEVDDDFRGAPAFSLEMYPSREQRGIAGRFIAEARERRRSGAGMVSADDRWMLESLGLPGGVHMPRLRWARKDGSDPETAAHVAVAFDTFESQVVLDSPGPSDEKPFRAFGLLSFYERGFTTEPTPVWRSAIPLAKEGEKHPSERGHTERLERLHHAMQGAVARHLGAGKEVGGTQPVLRTAVSREKADGLKDLHRLCDWVITLDRNAGIEYFDSPRDNQDVYDAYVIDCVPEREDLSCLQLITSTSNLDEVKALLDGALDQMGLSRSLRNAEFLLGHLKSLSGRLAIRLTGNKAPRSELIALAVSHANCRQALDTDPCWVSLDHGFIVPVDDVRDLLQPLTDQNDDGEKNEKDLRPDLIYVTTAARKGLTLRFIEVKYRRDLRAARSPDLLRRIHKQTKAMHRHWDDWYSHEVCSAFRAVRRAKLAHVLRFYADKAQRHHLPENRHAELVSEIDRMVERGGDYRLDTDETDDRGWVFCPEYVGEQPLKISPDRSGTKVFLFGPGLLPDSDFGQETTDMVPRQTPLAPAVSRDDTQLGRGSGFDTDATETIAMTDATREGEETNDVPSIHLGTDAATNAEVRWPLTIQGNPHLLMAGLPGMGKTTSLLNLCRQMVDAGIRPIVFSYHQDIDDRLVQSVKPVRFIDFDGLGFNPLHIVNRDMRMAHLDVAGAMRDIFAAIYPDLGDVQTSRIRQAIKESFTEAGWGDAGTATQDLQEPAFSRFVEILRADPKPDRGLRSLLTRLDELDDYGFFQVGESRGSLWESEQPTVVRIHTTQNDNLQRAFVSLVFYGLYNDMFRRGIQDRITHALIFDEAHRAAGLKLIPTMAKECRKYGISLVLASQEARDFHASVFSAIANYLVLRLTDADAKALVRNVSNSQQERVLMDRIKQMDRFKALYFCEGRNRPSRVDLSP